MAREDGVIMVCTSNVGITPTQMEAVEPADATPSQLTAWDELHRCLMEVRSLAREAGVGIQVSTDHPDRARLDAFGCTREPYAIGGGPITPRGAGARW